MLIALTFIPFWLVVDMKKSRVRPHAWQFESLEPRLMMSVDCQPLTHNSEFPEDVNADQLVSPMDALTLVNAINSKVAAQPLCSPVASGESAAMLDVSADGLLSPIDVLLVVNRLNAEAEESRDPSIRDRLRSEMSDVEKLGAPSLINEFDVETLLQRASQASASSDAIIAIVDRTGRILGVRVEAGVDAALQSDSAQLAFAIDGAVSKARTAAFFSSNSAPLTSRTVRFISQSTITQREVESSPGNWDILFKGPGFVAPIGVGGHFPPEIAFAPQVDLFAIEHQSRDRQLLSVGPDNEPGTLDDIKLQNRFNVHPLDVAIGAEAYLNEWPESYGVQSGQDLAAQARGIATLPGGIPLFKMVANNQGVLQPNLVGGIGVFFPGPDGFATYEQGFVPSSLRGGVPQSELERNNAPRVLEAEFIAFAAAAGGGVISPIGAFQRDVSEFNQYLAPLQNFVVLNGRFDLVGITLEIYGPTPNRSSPLPGIDQVIQLGRSLRPLGISSGHDQIVKGAAKYLAGQAVPEKWLVVPHAAKDGSLSAAQVEQIINQGIAEAELTRAAIRLTKDFRPGARTRMVFAVADKNGELLGVYRMPDATVFSIDVAIAKARNTAYYADEAALLPQDRVDFNGDGAFGPMSTDLHAPGDTLPLGTALTSRTFRFLVEPRYPTGADGTSTSPAPQSFLNMPGIDPRTAENSFAAPLPFSIYSDPLSRSTTAYDSFVPSRNFRDPGDVGVSIGDTGTRFPTANQNGVVFFPGSSPLYLNGKLIGGLGVSGDGVDQDDVVTAAGQVGFAAPNNMRADQFVVGGVRLPYQKFNRNPQGT